MAMDPLRVEPRRILPRAKVGEGAVAVARRKSSTQTLWSLTRPAPRIGLSRSSTFNSVSVKVAEVVPLAVISGRTMVGAVSTPFTKV